MMKFSLKTAAILSLSSCLLSGCGLKSGLYLPQAPAHVQVPVESTPVERTSASDPLQAPASSDANAAPAARTQN